MKGWESLDKFSNMSWFSENFPASIVDYYPTNLAESHNKPFLRKFSQVLDEYETPNPEPAGGWAQNGKSHKARYIHWRMTASEWKRVKHLLEPMDPFFTTDMQWIPKCIPRKLRRKSDGKVNWPYNNWIRHTHWKIIVIGEEDSGMFFHADGFSTSTFVFQFVGRKRWTLCRPQHEYMYSAGDVDTFSPDLERYPLFKNADCADLTVHPGEVMYYPSHYWHQTLNLDRPCVSMAGRRVDGYNADEVYGELQQRCRNPGPNVAKQWPGAAPILSKRNCKAVHKCYDLWKELFVDPLRKQLAESSEL